MLRHSYDERQLFLDYRRSQSVRDRDALIERYLPLARSLARRHLRGGEPLEDLEQVASVALIKAVERFDPTRGVAFSSFAVPSITGALKRHYRDHGWSVRMPRDLQDLALRSARAGEALSVKLGRSPTLAEVAAQVEDSVERVLEARQAHHALYAVSLNRPSAADGEHGAPLIDSLGGRDGELRRTFERVTLEALVDTLEERDRRLLQLYYRDELTQREIGQRLGFSQMHVSRLLRRARERLLAAADDAPVPVPA